MKRTDIYPTKREFEAGVTAMRAEGWSVAKVQRVKAYAPPGRLQSPEEYAAADPWLMQTRRDAGSDLAAYVLLAPFRLIGWLWGLRKRGYAVEYERA